MRAPPRLCRRPRGASAPVLRDGATVLVRVAIESGSGKRARQTKTTQQGLVRACGHKRELWKVTLVPCDATPPCDGSGCDECLMETVESSSESW